MRGSGSEPIDLKRCRRAHRTTCDESQRVEHSVLFYDFEPGVGGRPPHVSSGESR